MYSSIAVCEHSEWCSIICAQEKLAVSYAPITSTSWNNFVVVKFWTTCISFISSFSTIYITIFFWYTSSIDVLASEIINIKYKVCFMKEKMAIPVPGPQKSCYPPSERFSRHHEVVTITVHTKHIYKNVKELYLCVIHKKTVHHLHHTIELIRQYIFSFAS